MPLFMTPYNLSVYLLIASILVIHIPHSLLKRAYRLEYWLRSNMIRLILLLLLFCMNGRLILGSESEQSAELSVMSQSSCLSSERATYLNDNDAINRRIEALQDKINDKLQTRESQQEKALTERNFLLSIVGEAFMAEYAPKLAYIWLSSSWSTYLIMLNM